MAKRYGSETQLGSLELAMDENDVFGSCDIGFSCQYTSTISWRDEFTPLPMETNPRFIFERLFEGTRAGESKQMRAAIAIRRG